jgi:signal transduction histidine kinase
VDNGIGIPLADQRRIFEPFFRSDDRLRARSSGAGLGLAITKTLVTAHQGAIEVASQESRGTRMTVRLPVASRDNAEPEAS